MAQITPTYTPAYQVDELNFTRLQGAFADRAHDVYVIYDPTEDQIIVRLVSPNTLASDYYITDNIAFLVKENREVVGFTIVGFESVFLPQAAKLNDLWKRNNLSAHFSEYVKGRYEPKPHNHNINATGQRIVTYTAYQSKAAAAMVVA